MRRRLLLLFPVVLLAMAPARAEPVSSIHHKQSATKAGLKELTTQEIAKAALPSVVQIMVRDSSGEIAAQGSGFVIAPDAIATNVHVVNGAHAVTADFQDGRSVTVYGVIKMDTSRDLALIYADTTGTRALPLAPDGSAQIGDPVTAVGSPEGMGWSISTGIVSGIHSIGDTVVIQTTAPISHGSSGGALLDRYGRVLGVTSFYLPDGENMNFAYASTYLRALMPAQLPTYTSWTDMAAQWPPTGTTTAVAATPASPAGPAAPAAPANPADSSAPYTEKPLVGLTGVYVDPPNLSDDAKAEGMDAAVLQTQIELDLRKAGITVYDTMNDPANKSVADLLLIVNTLLSSDGTFYADDLSMSLNEVVTLVRSAPASANATTWTTGDFGMCPKGQLSSFLGPHIDEEANEFANDYLAANPKK